MELAIQKFLRENGLEAAVEKWFLNVNESGSLVQLNYNMYDSPKGVQECDECRGLILDRDNNWNVVAMSFRRFYNDGEEESANPNLATSKLQEKLDGSMIMLYWHPYNEEWVVATRGSVLASGSVGDLDKTFTELFWETAAKYPNFNLEETQDKNVTFVFELFGPENFVLTPYEESELRLLAARNIDTLEEMDNDYLNQVSEDWGIPRPRLYSFNTKEDILKIIEDFEATDEGFVLVDYEHRDNGNFQRVKIKNPRYVALHALLNAGNGNVFNKKCMLERILSGDAEEIITYFPKYEGYIRKIQDELDELCVMIQKDYERLAAMNLDKKAFAEEAKKTVWLHVLFAVNNGKVKNAREFVFAMRTETLLDLLEKTGIGE